MAHRRLAPSCPHEGCDAGCAHPWHDHVPVPRPQPPSAWWVVAAVAVLAAGTFLALVL